MVEYFIIFFIRYDVYVGSKITDGILKNMVAN